MRHASFFSGVGGLDLGFERAGIETVSVCEIDPYASSVLAERFPSAPNLGSITEVQADDIPEADIWSGGFPCQDLSLAGRRAGFSGKRSSLAFTFLDLVERRRPRWLVLENVPGLFSSNGGADFVRLLNEIDQLGYGVSWRTLDAQYFGVAQRRRRVFIVASLGTDCSAQVLFECEGSCRHLASSKQEGKDTSSGLENRPGISSGITPGISRSYSQTDTDGMRAVDGLARWVDNQFGLETVPAYGESIADTLAARDWKGGVANQDIGRKGYLGIVSQANFGDYRETDLASPVMTRAGNSSASSASIVVSTMRDEDVISFPSRYSNQPTKFDNKTDPLTISAGAPAVIHKGSVHHDEDPMLPLGLDSHRYRCCGNGVVSNVAEWIGRRIVAVDKRYDDV